MHPTTSDAKLYFYTPFRHRFVARTAGPYLHRFCSLVHSVMRRFERQGLLITLYLCFRLCEQFLIVKRIDGLDLTPLRILQHPFLLRSTPQFMEMSETEFDHLLRHGLAMVFSQDCVIVIEGWGNMTPIPI